MALLVDIAEYAGSLQLTSERAYETAHYCLMDALACGFQALQSPACTKLLGPVVPGATLNGGARVPGTSYELDPVNAAFNIGTMMRWSDGDPSHSLGAILAVADYRSRGGTALTVRDVLTGLIKAHEIQGVLAPDHVMPDSVACTAVVTAMMGGTRDQIGDAISNAWVEGGAGWRESWAAKEAPSRAVRLALFALKGGLGRPPAVTAGNRPTPARPLGSYVMENIYAGHRQWNGERLSVLVSKFETSVAAQFPAKQAESIRKMFAEPSGVAGLPVSHFIAKMVRAG